jgi:two-component system chemotaxis response regulator CheB
MPRHALAYASPQYVLPAPEIAAHLIELVEAGESAMVKKNSRPKKTNGKNHKNKISSQGLDQPGANLETISPDESEGTPSVFACPECHGVLWEFKDDEMVHFRCRVGHSYGTESLTTELSAASEAALWAAVRALEEKAAMQRRVAKGTSTDPNMSARLADQSDSDAGNARLIRDMIFRRDAQLEPEVASPEEPDEKIA